MTVSRSKLETGIIDAVLSREVPIPTLLHIRMVLDAVSLNSTDAGPMEKAARDAILYGTGFLKVSYVDPTHINQKHKEPDNG